MKIAIDGPSGAGKSTVAKAVANRLKINYLDTGAMYRAVAYAMIQQGIDPQNTAAVIQALPNIEMMVQYVDCVQKVLVNGEDVTPYLRTSQISKGASDIAVIPEVRKKLVQIQREVAEKYDIVMDGRDIGTYVLPNADRKFFLTATVEERAKRRYRELLEAGQMVELDIIQKEMEERDRTDSTREFAPLRQANDAILVDTTNLDQEQSIETIISYIVGGTD
jgi:cytidylate kinase